MFMLHQTLLVLVHTSHTVVTRAINLQQHHQRHHHPNIHSNSKSSLTNKATQPNPHQSNIAYKALKEIQ
jgi:hypothetical protein